MKAGATIIVDGRNTAVDYRFIQLADQLPEIRQIDTPDRAHADIGIGANIGFGTNTSLSLVGDAAVSKNSYSLGGRAKFRFKF